MGITESWDRIERWLAIHAADVLPSLRPPAESSAVAELEATAGVVLPADFKISVMCHDGQEDPAASGLVPHSGVLGPEPAWQFASIDYILKEWSMLAELLDGGDFAGNKPKPGPGIKAKWWHKAWIPIAGNGGGDHVCLDMDPEVGGSPGQVILFRHDARDRSLLAPSFEAWLSKVADGMESGRYKFDPDGWGLVEVEDE